MIFEKETSASVKAGALAGLCFGVFSTALVIALSWQSFVELELQVASEMKGMMSVSDLMKGTIGMGLAAAGLFDMLLGVLMGVLFVKTVDRLPHPSTYVRAIVFGFILWLFPFTAALLIGPVFGMLTVELFIVALLLLIVLDSTLFAYVFNWLSKPPKPNLSETPKWLKPLLTPRNMALPQ